MKKINFGNSKVASIILILMLLAYQILPQELNLIILILILFYFICIKRNKIFIKFPGYQIYFTMFLCGSVIGICNTIIGKNNIYIYIKHMYYMLLPFLYWEIGMMLVTSYKLDKFTVYNLIIYSATIYVAYDWINIIFNCLKTDIFNMTLYQFRNIISAGSMLPLIGFWLLYFFEDNNSLSKTRKQILKYLFLTNIIIHLSRTHILTLVILILFSGLRMNLKKNLKLITGVLVITFIVSITFPSMFSSFISKINNSFNEIKHSNDTWTHIEIVKNWRGYEMYCELQQFSNANTFEKIFGAGFGKTLDVLGYAYLVSNEDSLTFLHNGYYTQLMIYGIVGVCFYIIWIIKLYSEGKKQNDKMEGNFLKGMAIVILVTSYFVAGPFYSVGQATYLFYFGLLKGLNHTKTRIKEIDES